MLSILPELRVYVGHIAIFSVSSGYSPKVMIVLHKYMVSLLEHHYTRSGQKRWHGVVMYMYVLASSPGPLFRREGLGIH